MSQKKLVKKNCRCSFSPTFRVSSCPQQPQKNNNEPIPPPPLSPTYGSLSSAAGVSITAVQGENIDFNFAGPTNGLTADTTTDSIIIDSTGVYTVSFTIEVLATGAAGSVNATILLLSISGNDYFPFEVSYQTELGSSFEINTLSRIAQLTLNQGDVIQVYLFSVDGATSYLNASLVVTKVA